MEKKHKQRMCENFADATNDKKIIILDIPDDYQYMDPGLIEEIKSKVETYIEL